MNTQWNEFESRYSLSSPIDGSARSRRTTGPFATEVKHPRDIRVDVEAPATAVLKHDDLTFDLVDDLGQPWTAAMANEQLRRLGVEYRPGRGT